jgi:hypothetical protein
MAVDPYKRVSWRGVTVNQRTQEMLEVTELRGLRDLMPLRIVQGSYNKGVTQSGGTHDGGGALDVSLLNRTANERDRIVRELRETSFAAWYRAPIPGVWSAHIHAIAIGDQEMSPQAAQQVVWYREGKNGLWPSGGGPDTGPDVPIHVYRQDIDMSYLGPMHWDEDDFRRLIRWLDGPIAEAVWAYLVSNLNTDPATQIAAKSSLAFTHQHATDGDVQASAANKKADQILEAVGKLVPPPVPPV